MSAAIVYGAPPADLATTPAGAQQVSPLVPGSERLEAIAPASLDAAVLAAPPGTIERRYVLALALRALKPGAPLTALAPKDKGGSRIGKELQTLGCRVDETGRRHQRICLTTAPADAEAVHAAIDAGAPRFDPAQGLWTQPGVFSWDRTDPGSRLLRQTLPALSGRVADLGCGTGFLSHAVLANPAVTHLDLVDLDRRAVDCAQRNVDDPRVSFHWQDARLAPDLEGLNAVVTNPPFHDGGTEDRALGQGFIGRAHAMLRKGGVLWLVANRHLPYEEPLNAAFARVALKAEAGGFKVYEARK
jgi:16S rRNA (guanine1207-N2)-methyltransferase